MRVVARMTSDGQPSNSYDYLRTLRPEARAMQAAELERGVLAGEESPQRTYPAGTAPHHPACAAACRPHGRGCANVLASVGPFRQRRFGGSEARWAHCAG